VFSLITARPRLDRGCFRVVFLDCENGVGEPLVGRAARYVPKLWRLSAAIGVSDENDADAKLQRDRLDRLDESRVINPRLPRSQRRRDRIDNNDPLAFPRSLANPVRDLIET